MTKAKYILRASAPDAVGILADVTGALASHRLNVIESQDYGDSETDRFFIWAKFESEDGFNEQSFRDTLTTLAERRNLEWSLRREAAKLKALVMASKSDHCLNDLLYRNRRGRLGAEIVAIVSNHLDAKWHADRHETPFFHIPVTRENKGEAEKHLIKLIAETKTDFVVLARYMQVLSDDLSKRLQGRCINIHHSALPSFKGAKPYHQAHERGVKLIGATAHYVTADLDEGPIITQETMPVDHRLSAERLVERGRDVEARVLARAVTAHAEGRVFLNGVRTIVFE